MKVLHIITGLQTGGAERQLSLLLDACRDSGLDHAVMVLGEVGYLADSISACGVPIHWLNLSKSPRALLGSGKVMKVVKKEKPDLIQGWMYHGNLAASFAGFLGRRKALWNIRHSLSEFNIEKKSTRIVIRSGAAWSESAAKIIYNSHAGAGQHKSAGYDGAESVVIPNGYDCSVFRSDNLARERMRAELGFDETHLVIGCMARFHPMKDHGNFLRAAAIVKDQYPQTQFVLAGSRVTAENPELSRLVGELGLSASVRLLGEREDMVQVYGALDILASSSSWGEAFPNVLGEAMACGVPCVATDVGDTRSLLDNTGSVVAPRDAEALAAGILELCRAKSEVRRSLGVSARERIVKHYSLQTMAQRYETLYRSVATA